MKQPRAMRLLAVLLAAASVLPSACGGEGRTGTGNVPPGAMFGAGPIEFIAGPSDHAPTPFLMDPSVPPAGLDPEWKQLVDGAGKPGPIWVRLTFVYPSPGAEIDPAPVINGIGPPGRVFHYVAEACMDSVSNPQNNAFLSSAFIRGYWSADGAMPINRTTDSAVQVIHDVVPNGGCVTMRRIPPEWGGRHGEQWVFFDPPGGRYLIFAARYGSDEFFAWNSAPCPASEQLEAAATRPTCTLRSAHLLDYQWADGTVPVSYDGQWSGSGTGTSAASTPARADVTFDVSDNRIGRFTVPFRIDTAPGVSPSSCGGTSAFGGGRITNGTFTINGGITYVFAITGTFTSPATASGTIQIVPGSAASPWCQSATIAWTARRQ